MKPIILLSLAVLATTCVAQQDSAVVDQQNTEFRIHENGLIYDDETMKKLSHIVDSLNIRFRQCEPRDYKSFAQGFATFVTVDKNKKAATGAIRDNISLEAFRKKFPKAEVERVRIYKYTFTNYKKERTVCYTSFPFPDDNEKALYLPLTNANDKTNGWVMEEDEDVSALFLEDLESPSFPQVYAQLIQYVDCMVDTTATIYFQEAERETFDSLPPGSKVRQYLELANDFGGEPEYPRDLDVETPFYEQAIHKYRREHAQWNNKRLAALDEKMKEQHNQILLQEATDEALSLGRSSDVLEFYVERYLSPGQALKLKRHRQVVGFCSMDSRPRDHAADICRLAATTAQWDIFLRAHLDIMNDNFVRASDGSYAWAGRGTYLKELEALNINATDLLIGTCLRSSTVSDNHYHGDISRIGRALAESHDLDAVSTRLLAMIKDDQLDLFNRLLTVYVFNHFNYNLPEDAVERRKANVAELQAAIATLPDDLVKALEKLR